MAVALFFSASMLCIWRVLHRVTWQNLIVGSLVMGCLFVSKFSGVLILPMGMLLVAIQLISRQPTVVAFRGKTWTVERRATRLLVHVSTIAVHAIVAWGVIWAFFDFRYDMSPTKTLEPNTAGETVVADRPYMTWDVLLKDSPSMESIIGRVREAHLLPETYVYGFVHTWRFSRERTSFLNGEFGISGWPEFFPYCLLFKTPLTFFALMMLGMAWTIRGWYLAGDGQARVSAMLASCYRTAPLWVLFVVYWAFAIPSHLNIGHRHLLPTYPPMFILAGASAFWLASPAAERKRGASRQASWLATRRWPALACTVLACIGLFAAESLWRWPNYLAYFNQIAGGPSQGYRQRRKRRIAYRLAKRISLTSVSLIRRITAFRRRCCRVIRDAQSVSRNRCNPERIASALPCCRICTCNSSADLGPRTSKPATRSWSRKCANLTKQTPTNAASS
jgi:hypothetical protein